MTPLDNEIPFIPSFIWIYHTLLPVFFYTIYKFNIAKEFYLLFWSATLATFLISVCYVLLPSFYPYPTFEPTTTSEWLTYWTHKIDGASNTFPSGHVGFSWLLYLSIAHSVENRKYKRYYLVWAMLIAVSTLVLKQHYIVDIFAGWLLAMACFYSVKYVIERKYANSKRPTVPSTTMPTLQ
jgi:membrane-associated phospholipid phosphatase